MAAVVNTMDDLVKDYLLFRGFVNTLKTLETEIKNDKDRGLRPEKIIDVFQGYVNSYDISGLREFWAYLEHRFFSRLASVYMSSVHKLEMSLFRWYIINALQNNKNDKVLEFFEKMSKELQPQPEWRDWFSLPFINKPEEVQAFQMYFTKQWQDTFLLSLHNFLSVIFQSMPLPSLLMFEEDLKRTKILQMECDHYKKRLASLRVENADFVPDMTQFTDPKPKQIIQYNHLELVDDFYDQSSNEASGGTTGDESKTTGMRKFLGKIANPSSPGLKLRNPPVNVPQPQQPQKKPVLVKDTRAKSVPAAKPVTTTRKKKYSVEVRGRRPEEVKTTRDLGTTSRDPSTASRDPSTASRDPSASSRDAGTASRDAGTVSRDPATSSRDPSTSKPRDPATSPREPSTPKPRDPGAPSRDPATSSRDPATSSRDPSESTPYILLSQDEYAEHHSAITHCRFSDSGKHVASSDMDGVVKVWGLNPTPTTISTIMSKASIMCFEWASKMDRLILLGNKASQLKLYDIKEKKNLIDVSLDPAFPRITTLLSNPTGTSFACAASSKGGGYLYEKSPRTGRLSIWNLKSMEKEKDIPTGPSSSAVTSMTYNHNGQLLLVGSTNGTIKLFDVQNSNCISSWAAHNGDVYTLQFSRDENSCYSLGADGRFVQWSVHNNGTVVHEFSFHTGLAGPFAVSTFTGQKTVVTPRGRLFVCDGEKQCTLTCGGNSGVIYSLNVPSTRPLLVLNGHKSPVITVDWASQQESRMCLTGSMDGKIVLSTLLK